LANSVEDTSKPRAFSPDEGRHVVFANANYVRFSSTHNNEKELFQQYELKNDNALTTGANETAHQSRSELPNNY